MSEKTRDEKGRFVKSESPSEAGDGSADTLSSEIEEAPAEAPTDPVQIALQLSITNANLLQQFGGELSNISRRQQELIEAMRKQPDASGAGILAELGKDENKWARDLLATIGGGVQRWLTGSEQSGTFSKEVEKLRADAAMKAEKQFYQSVASVFTAFKEGRILIQPKDFHEPEGGDEK